jgi:hypothetical protein
MNNVTCKYIFPLFKNNRIWFGRSITKGDVPFAIPNDYKGTPLVHGFDENNRRIIRFACIRWFTNLYPDNYSTRPALTLTHTYTPDKYPQYDKYNAIEVPKVALIPKDYIGVMGVPITFFDKYNPDQFTIIGLDRWVAGDRLYINGKRQYARILIQRKVL